MVWIFGKPWQSNTRIDGRTAIVTGSNTGLGYHTALDLYKLGGRVILASRNKSKLNEALKRIKNSCGHLKNVGELAILELDLSSLESVRKGAHKLLSEENNIHILVNNAGVVLPQREVTVDGYEKQFATNYLGHFLFTLLLLPRLIRSAPSRIINITSEPHCIANDIDLDDINCEKSYFYHTVYSQTKLANILFSNELAKRLNLAGVVGVTVYSVNPGPIDSKMSEDFAAMILPGVRQLYCWMKWMFMPSPAQAALTSVYCSIAEETAQQTSLYYANCRVAVPPKSTRNEFKAKQLWDLSLKMTHLDKNIEIFSPS